MSSWELQKREFDRHFQLMQAGTISELAEEALQQALPHNVEDLIVRIQELATPDQPLSPTMLNMIEKAREITLNGTPAESRNALVELLWQVGIAIVPLRPQLGSRLIDAMAVEREEVPG